MIKMLLILFIELVLSSCTGIIAAANSDNALTFYLLGDWGKGGNSGSFWNKGSAAEEDESLSHLLPNGGSKVFYQAAVSKAMGNYGLTSDPSPSFVVALGDNFYTNGVTSATDQSWMYLWEEVYLPYSALNIPWYPVFGNHDYAGTPQAQLNRSVANPNGLWQFPAAYYTKTFFIPGGGRVQIIFIDTTTLAPNVCKYTSDKGGVSTDTQAQRINAQLEFLTNTLDAAVLDPPTWLIVAGHYPLYSRGSHGDTSELKSYIASIFPKYGINAYICGHDHISEHLVKDGTHYFVAGAGSMTDTLGSYSSEATTLWTGTEYSAFSVMTATLTQLSIEYIDATGTSRYTYTVDAPYSEDSSGPSGPPNPGENPDSSHPFRKSKNGGVAGFLNEVFNSADVMTAGGLFIIVALIAVLAAIAHQRATTPIILTKPMVVFKGDNERVHSIKALYDKNINSDSSDDIDFQVKPKRITLSPYAPLSRNETSLSAAATSNPFDEEEMIVEDRSKKQSNRNTQAFGSLVAFLHSSSAGGSSTTVRSKIESHRRMKSGPL